MKILPIVYLFFAVLLFLPVGIRAQTSGIAKTELGQAEIDGIIKKMTEHEREFRSALDSYVFTRRATINSIGLGGQITGTYRRDSYMSFDDKGNRYEKILFAPLPTITGFTVTPEDIDNLGGINPFALDPSQIAQYNFSFLGKERIDELDLYVFDVAPKFMPDPKKSDDRFFQGRIWVDDRDLLIVRSKGKAVPEGKNRRGIDQVYPIVDTWRINIDGRYWFPSYSSSDNDLVFSSGQVVKQKMRVTYTNYALGRSTVIILGDEEPVPPTPDKPDKP